MSDPTSGRNWLETYIEYSGQSEAPEVFHKWIGLSVLSAVLRRKVWIDNGYSRLFPNLYVVLVASPGRCRKSSAINMGKDILNEVQGVVIESNKMTTSALIDTLCGAGVSLGKKTIPPILSDDVNGEPADNLITAAMGAAAPTSKMVLYRECTAALISTEFSVMLGAESHQSGLIPLLTDLYDCPTEWKYKTRGRGEEILDNVYLSLLAASTAEWLGQAIPMSAIGGGFTSRIIFIVQKHPRKPVPRPKVTAYEKQLKAKLVIDLNAINSLRGEAKLSKKAEEYFDQWYITDRVPPTINERFAGYFERRQDHLLKLALIHSVSESDSLVISRRHLIKSLDCLDLVEHLMPEAFAGIGTATTAYISKIIEQIEAGGRELEYSELVRKNFQMITVEDMGLILRTMYDAGIAKEIVRNGTRYIQLK